MALTDPAIDVAGVFHWGGEAFLQHVLAAYEAPFDDGLPGRARFMAACRGVGDVVFGIERQRPEHIAAGLRALTFAVRA